MKTAAFITYNVMDGNIASGWHEAGERRSLVLQNTRRNGSWGNPIGVAARSEQSLTLWGQLQNALPEIDHVVVYVGANGSENAIALSAQLPADKVTYVMCSCEWHAKTTLVRRAGMSASRVIDCACGGHRAMRRLYDSFMKTGKIL
jgi:hypothetical protein